MKLVVYTALIGQYDVLTPAPENSSSVAFLDEDQPSMGWTVRSVPSAANSLLTARMYKILSHRWFPDADVTIWLDAAITMRTQPENLLDWIKEHNISAFAHPSRDCAYAEGARCIVKGKASAEVISRQLAAYREAGFPEHWGLVETGVLVRRHTQAVADLNELWWEQVLRYSKRDQVSLPFALWKKGLQIYRSGDNLIRHPWFKHHGHRGK